MSVDLKDFRGRITLETDAVLEGISRVTGQDRQEIARVVLHEWAAKRLEESRVFHRLLQAEGLPGIADGTAGNVVAREGTCGNACRNGGAR